MGMVLNFPHGKMLGAKISDMLKNTYVLYVNRDAK